MRKAKTTPSSSFLAALAAPARRALQNAGITTLAQLAQRSESEILSLHGMGPSSLPKLRQLLQSEKRTFRQAPTRGRARSTA